MRFEPRLFCATDEPGVAETACRQRLNESCQTSACLALSSAKPTATKTVIAPMAADVRTDIVPRFHPFQTLSTPAPARIDQPRPARYVNRSAATCGPNGITPDMGTSSSA